MIKDWFFFFSVTFIFGLYGYMLGLRKGQKKNILYGYKDVVPKMSSYAKNSQD